LQLPRTIYEEMLAHARAELPNECCGLLAGTPNGRVICRYSLINEAASPKEYLSEPRSMFAAVKDMRGRQIDILAVYHSHPTSEPVPSKTDLERNYSAEVVNFIISLKNGEAQMRGWWLSDRGTQEAEWDWLEHDDAG
jgi:[CysO sulfur-carrier protein]-S-L-cysteine hydrolase